MIKYSRYKYFSIIVLIFSVLQLSAQKKTKTTDNILRTKLNINREWRFVLGDSINAQDVSFNDKYWHKVNLPHSMSAPYFMWSTFYVGYGWYRKQIDVPSTWLSKNVTLEFEGSFIETEVYVNGTYIGKHVGGYTGFYFDISKYLTTGTNLIAVRVNNKWNARVAPRAGDHQFGGGLYRDVYLNVTDKLHVDWCGTFFTTPTVSTTSAACMAQTEVRNDNVSKKYFLIKTDIYDPNGTLVTSTTSADTVAAGAVKIVKQILPNFANPMLWSPSSPVLHKAVTTITTDGADVDSYETSFGVRWFTWTSDKGFFINGNHLFLLGANVHQDQAGWGDGVTNKAAYRDVKMMKDAGFNCIRGSHYPHDPAFTQACDELGIIYFSENAFWGMGGCSGDQGGWINGSTPSSCYPPTITDQSFFNQSVLGQLKEMIHIHRNRASIAAWSMCNEPFFTDNSTISAMKALLNVATDSSKRWDSSRAVAIGGCQRQDIDKLGKGQIAFYNGDGASLSTCRNPGIPNLVSEYGSTVTYRPGSFAPGWGNVTEGLTDSVSNVWRSGHIIWCGFDHGTVGGTGLATMGLVDYFRIPKRAYYWYQQAYVQKKSSLVAPTWPVSGTAAKLKIEASSTTIGSTDGTDDVQLLISVLDKNSKQISNNVPVKLEVISGPGEFPTGTTINFAAPSTAEASDISIRDGQCAISFRSYYGGTTLIKATSVGLTADSIAITTLGTPVFEQGVTQKTEDRPYKRYSATTTSTSTNNMLLVKSRPVEVSSTLSGHNKIYINDDDTTTLWKPELNDTAKWCILDMEGTYSVNRIEIRFPSVGAYRYYILVSSDGTNWTKVIDQTVSSINDKLRMAYGNLGQNIRYIKIKFVSSLAGFAEVRVGGAANLTYDSSILTGTIIGTNGSWNNSTTATRENAFDFDMSTFFDAPSGAANMWVGLDLGYQAEYNVTNVKYVPRSANSILAGRMLNGTFQVANSADFSDKITIYTITSTPALNSYTNAITSNTYYTRYLRYLSTTAGNGNVSELEFHGIPRITNNQELQLIKKVQLSYQKNNQTIKISIGSNQRGFISLFDMDGRMLDKRMTTGNETNIPANGFSKGTYIVSVTIADEVYNEKLIVN